jgi:hypothetical protein
VNTLSDQELARTDFLFTNYSRLAFLNGVVAFLATGFFAIGWCCELDFISEISFPLRTTGDTVLFFLGAATLLSANLASILYFVSHGERRSDLAYHDYLNACDRSERASSEYDIAPGDDL